MNTASIASTIDTDIKAGDVIYVRRARYGEKRRREFRVTQVRSEPTADGGTRISFAGITHHRAARGGSWVATATTAFLTDVVR